MQESDAASNVVRWKHLTRALDSLTAASKLPSAKNLPRIHFRRGDCEMHRRSLGSAPSAYDIAVKSAPTLLKNAEIFYRGAAKVANVEATHEEEVEASTKEAVVAGLSGSLNRLQEKADGGKARVQEVAESTCHPFCLVGNVVFLIRFSRLGYTVVRGFLAA